MSKVHVVYESNILGGQRVIAVYTEEAELDAAKAAGNLMRKMQTFELLKPGEKVPDGQG